MSPIRAIYRWYLRQQLKWIKDLQADEVDRHAKFDAAMRGLRTEEAHLLWKLNGRPSQAYGLQGLRQRRRA